MRVLVLLAILLLARAQDSTTGRAPDAGTTSSLTDCGGTKAPAEPLAPGATPAPTLSFRCLPESYFDSTTTTSAPTAAAGSMDTPSPTEAPDTPEPTVVADSTGMEPTEAGAVGDGDRDIVGSPAPTVVAATEEDEDADVDAGADEDADGVPTTPAPTNEAGLTREEAEAEAEGDTTDGALGLVPRASGAALAASCGLLLAAGILAL